MKYFEITSDNDIRGKILKETTADSDVPKIAVTDIKGEAILKDLEAKKLIYVDYKTKKFSITSAEDESSFDSEIKKAVEVQIKEKFQKMNSLSASINMVLYVDALIALADAGFHVTNENREEKYIEIIETGDERLIGMLEAYIEAKDEVDSLKWHKQQLHKKLETLQDLEEGTPEFKKFVDSIQVI